MSNNTRPGKSLREAGENRFWTSRNRRGPGQRAKIPDQVFLTSIGYYPLYRCVAFQNPRPGTRNTRPGIMTGDRERRLLKACLCVFARGQLSFGSQKPKGRTKERKGDLRAFLEWNWRISLPWKLEEQAQT
ncbi:unnamed protein product [Linum trigynum]|uniref:Uncharacterized protein n=1 Tax=Linum trigynum TaxID=586398 RepID=A0AAV2CZ08_9ROSI